MGFDGKQCIHPAQLAAVNAIFTPSLEEVTKAERGGARLRSGRRRRTGCRDA